MPTRQSEIQILTKREMMTFTVPISPGELIDKITILEIKSERIQDKDSLQFIQTELELLLGVFSRKAAMHAKLQNLKLELKKVNEVLWQIEDDIRICEKEKDFGERFIELARSVYITNDKRAELKGRINKLLDSNIQEVKSYEDYS